MHTVRGEKYLPKPVGATKNNISFKSLFFVQCTAQWYSAYSWKYQALPQSKKNKVKIIIAL